MSKLYQTVLQTNEKHALLRAGDRVLCGVSGGADSIALLHLLAKKQAELGISVCAIHVNHGLRGETALRDEAFVCDFCKKLDVPLEISHVQVKTGASVEAHAREARYAAFEHAAEKHNCNRIATAHNMNDNVETVLFRLSRGTGTTGLRGIVPKREKFIRPLIDCTRDEILEYLQEFGLSSCFDETNDLLCFSRNRIRKQVLPQLQESHPGALQAIHRTSRLLACDTDYFDSEITKLMQNAVFDAEQLRYSVETLLKLHIALQTRLLLRLAQAAANHPSYCLEFQHIEAIQKLLKNISPSGELSLPGGLFVRRAYDEVVFFYPRKRDTTAQVLREGETVYFGRYQVSYTKEKPHNIHKKFTLYEVDSAIISNQIIVRSREIGDRLHLPKRKAKSLKQFMIEEKIERCLRDELPVISDGNKVVLVHGFGVDERYCAREVADKKYIKIGLCEE